MNDSFAFGHTGVRVAADGTATPFNDTDLYDRDLDSARYAVMHETPPCMGNAPPVDGAIRHVSEVEPLHFGRGFRFTYQRRIKGKWEDCDQVAKTRDGAEFIRDKIIGKPYKPEIAGFPGGMGAD